MRSVFLKSLGIREQMKLNDKPPIVSNLEDCEKIAQFLAVMGVRNHTKLEDLHAGTTPSSKAGDYSDVKVVSPYGEVPWTKLSRISDKEMRILMLSIEQAIRKSLELLVISRPETLEYLLTNPLVRRSYDDPTVGELIERQT